jgi:hypothetical protein
VHVCHSPQREVEILHDQLLAMLQDDPELTPRDIVVMVADIDSYSPFIQAVLAVRQASDICLTPFLTVVRVSLTRYCRHLSACCHCRTAGLSLKMCWLCWMCLCWPHASTSTKRVTLPSPVGE